MAAKKGKSAEPALRKKQHAMQVTILSGKPTTLPTMDGTKKMPTKKATSSMFTTDKHGKRKKK
jgi:hypothetical protein